MTYIIGWKQSNAIFLCADTVMTTDDVSSTTAMSSFGEHHLVSDDCYVGERAIKLINLTVAAAAISGYWAPAHALLEEFSGRLKAGDTPIHAIERAVVNHTPLKPDSPFNLIVALRHVDEPILLGFNVNEDQDLTEVPHGTLIHFGSMPSVHKTITPQFLNMLKRTFDGQSDRMLAATLGVLQSFGIHDYLLDHGAGGAFCGLYLDPKGARWQGDILNLLYTPKIDKFDMVASIVRDNVLIVRSNINHKCNYFGDSLMGGLGQEWRKRYWESSFEHIRSGRFDFINLLSKRNRTVTIAEMRRQLKSDHIHVTPSPVRTANEVNFELGFDYSPTVYELMTLVTPDRDDETIPYRISWIPFQHSA